MDEKFSRSKGNCIEKSSIGKDHEKSSTVEKYKESFVMFDDEDAALEHGKVDERN